MLNKDFSQMNFHPKIVLIYALLSLQRRESNLRAFLIQNLNFARLFARLTPVFLLKKSARLLQKMSPSEEFATLTTFHGEMPKIVLINIQPPAFDKVRN